MVKAGNMLGRLIPMAWQQHENLSLQVQVSVPVQGNSQPLRLSQVGPSRSLQPEGEPLGQTLALQAEEMQGAASNTLLKQKTDWKFLMLEKSNMIS